MNDYLIRKKLKNSEGKRLIEKTILEYSKDIIKYIINDPSMLIDVIEELEITEQEFYEYIS